MTVMAAAPVRDYLHGWCAPCYRGDGRLVPAVDVVLQACQKHVRLLPARPVLAGQLALDLDVPAAPVWYETGLRVPCADCAARGVPRPRMGLPERTPGDPMPLCLTCWRSRSDRAYRRGVRRGLSAEETGWVADLAERLACEACGPDAPSAAGEDLLPPAAAAARRRQVEAQRRRRRRERDRPATRGRSRRRVGCWRCTDAPWLEAVRAVHAYDQAQAAAELGQAEELADEHEAALARVRRAERRLQVVTQWRERIERVVAAIPRLTKTGPRGRLEVARGAGLWARAWELVADFLARDDAERTGRGVRGRGRPPEYPRVVAVMAVAASYDAGHGSMAGLDWTKLFADVSGRTVTTGWARAVELGCATLVERGRILRVEERRALQRSRQRAVHDFTPLRLSPVDARAYRADAQLLLAQLLQRAVVLVEEHRATVEEERTAAAAVEAELLDVRAWLAEQHGESLAVQALVDPVWSEDAEAAAAAARLARARATRAAQPSTDARVRVAAARAAKASAAAAVEAVDNAFEQARRMRSFCDHPRKGSRSSFSSCLRFGGKDSASAYVTLAAGLRPTGRGDDQEQVGASRSSTRGVARPTTPRHPRTGTGGVLSGSPGRRSVMWWAKPLARALASRWAFLGRYLDDADDGRRRPHLVARERGLRIHMIAATLGTRLGPQWSADDVVSLVERHAGIHSVIAPGDAHSPLRYLAVMLERALTDPDAQVPHHSPVRQAYEQAVLDAELAAEAARGAGLRTEFDQRDAAAAAERSGPRLGLAAARKAAAGRRPASGRSEDPAGHEHRNQASAPAAGADWPTVREPGSGPIRRLDPGAGTPSGRAPETGPGRLVG